MPRLKQLLVAGELIAAWLRDGQTSRALPVADCLPDDVSLFGVYNVRPGLIGLVFESATFAEVPAGTEARALPVLPPIRFRRAFAEPGTILPSLN